LDYSNLTDEQLYILKHDLEQNISKYNNEQMAFKIAMNSLDKYGASISNGGMIIL